VAVLISGKLEIPFPKLLEITVIRNSD
jgi:hypothetical protein